MRRLSIIFLLLTTLAARAADRAPEDVLHEFYSWVISDQKKQSSSLPSIDERNKLATIVSPHLIKLFVDASKAEQRCFASVEGTTDKPYFFEADIFTGSWEVASEVAYGKINLMKGKATVEVSHVAINSKFPKADRNRVLIWRNSVHLRNRGGVWLIYDLRYDDGTTLSGRISEYLYKSKKWCRG